MILIVRVTFDNCGRDYDVDNDQFDNDDKNDEDVSHLANDMIFAAAEDCGFSNKSHSACFTHQHNLHLDLVDKKPVGREQSIHLQSPPLVLPPP